MAAAAAALQRGEVIAYPTETVYGLGVDPDQEGALQRLIKLKGRPPEKGFILLVSSLAQLGQLTPVPLSPLAQQLADRFWPGPLTLVLPAKPGLSSLITGGLSTVAVRCSSSPLVKALLKLWHKPLISTSANPYGTPPLTDPAQIDAVLGSQIGLILPGDGGGDGQPSTILKVDGDSVVLIREGGLTREVAGEVVSGLVG
ncbi:MAG: threonylcarbamoyl-AMP synthase [Magnetococcales bacterium]|nr:threonylcarbamoyl-AMP synthase [Magnetococcales bacterium]